MKNRGILQIGLLALMLVLAACSGQREAVGEKEIEETLLTVAGTDSELIVIYYNGESAQELGREEVEVRDKTPESILAALARHNIVSLDTKVLSFEVTDLVGEKYAYLDLSGAFAEYLGMMTDEAESVIIASLVNTYLENYGASKLFLTVEGETLQTTYRSYEKGIGKSMPEDILRLSKEDVPTLSEE